MMSVAVRTMMNGGDGRNLRAKSVRLPYLMQPLERASR